VIVEHYEITPMPALRWGPEKFTPRAKRYASYLNDLRKIRFRLPQPFYHAVFILPIPKSWSKKKKFETCYTDHRSRPDRDNLDKAVGDIIPEDMHIARGYPSKIWGPFGCIVVATEALYTTESDHEVRVIMEEIMMRQYGPRAAVSQYARRR